jgi:hypothetical protein
MKPLILLLSVLILSSFAQARTFVLPHILEKSGAMATSNGLDNHIVAVYATGLTGAGPRLTEVKVSLFLFEGNGDRLMKTASGNTICGPCVATLSASNRKVDFNVDALIVAAGGFGRTQFKVGYALLVVDGDQAKNVAVSAFVMNSFSGPMDLRLAPVELQEM